MNDVYPPPLDDTQPSQPTVKIEPPTTPVVYNWTEPRSSLFFDIKVLLICWQQDDGKPSDAWYETYTFTWHLSTALTHENVKRRVEAMPAVEGVYWAVYKVGVVQP